MEKPNDGFTRIIIIGFLKRIENKHELNKKKYIVLIINL